MVELKNIYNSDSVKFMNEQMDEASVDLIVTSPPYGVGIDYDNWDDDMMFNEYMKFSREWLTSRRWKDCTEYSL